MLDESSRRVQNQTLGHRGRCDDCRCNRRRTALLLATIVNDGRYTPKASAAERARRGARRARPSVHCRNRSVGRGRPSATRWRAEVAQFPKNTIRSKLRDEGSIGESGALKRDGSLRRVYLFDKLFGAKVAHAAASWGLVGLRCVVEATSVGWAAAEMGDLVGERIGAGADSP